MSKLKPDPTTRSAWCSASQEDLQDAILCLRNNCVSTLGPFVIKTGIAIFKISNYLLTADELVALHRTGHLTESGLAEFARQLNTAAIRLGTERRQ